MAEALRIGVLGLGRAGASMLAAMAVHPDIKVAAAADLHAQHLERFERDFGGQTYREAEALCQSPAVDAVYVATPHQFHAAHVELAASYGKHVLVEKPMALTLDECDRMIAACERAGVALVVGHTASFNPGVLKMRELVASGAVGQLAMLSATAYTDFLYRPRRPEELVTELGGGIIYNQVPHQVDAARYLAGGMARSVRAATWVLDPARPTEGCYLAFVEFENGAAAALVYSGYDHANSGELAAGRGVGAPESYGAARREVRGARSSDDEVEMRISTGYGGTNPVSGGRGRPSLLQPELGVFIATCAGADLRLAPDGVLVFGDEGLRVEEPAAWRGVPGRGNTLDELLFGARGERRVVHDGRWAKATMEVCLAMLVSSREHHEVRLEFQVPTVDSF